MDNNKGKAYRSKTTTSMKRRKIESKNKVKDHERGPMTGSIAVNLHEGSRSEYLAQYVFSSWGTVVAVPHHEDHGLDMHCTFMERVGKRGWAKFPYTVQVRSQMKPWLINGKKSVKWLVEHPLPLFLCVVEKRASVLRVYQTCPRYYVWALGDSPNRLTMTPSMEKEGHCTEWSGGYDFSLSAPILEIAVSRMGDDAYWANARRVLEDWLEVENYNLTSIRAGLMRFRMPQKYKTNEPGPHSISEQGLSCPSEDQIRRGIVHLSECLIWLGSQLRHSDDFLGAVEAGLLLRHIQKRFPQFFDERFGVGQLSPLYSQLTKQIPDIRKDYLYAGIEEVERHVKSALPTAGVRSDGNAP